MLLDVSMQLIPELLQRYQLQSTARILNQRAEHLSSTYHTKVGCQPLSSNNYVRLNYCWEFASFLYLFVTLVKPNALLAAEPMLELFSHQS